MTLWSSAAPFHAYGDMRASPSSANEYLKPSVATILLLLTSHHASCRHLRTMIETGHGWKVVGDHNSDRLAESRARRLKPDLILVATDLQAEQLAELIGRLHVQSPDSRIALFGETREEVLCEHPHLPAVMIRGLWRDVGPDQLASMPGSSMQGLYVESPLLHSGADPSRRAHETETLELDLDELEVALLTGMREGKSQLEVAREQSVSERQGPGLRRVITVCRSSRETCTNLRM
jgi:DNA-binding NarL/FixJ family response regulator